MAFSQSDGLLGLECGQFGGAQAGYAARQVAAAHARTDPGMPASVTADRRAHTLTRMAHDDPLPPDQDMAGKLGGDVPFVQYGRAELGRALGIKPECERDIVSEPLDVPAGATARQHALAGMRAGIPRLIEIVRDPDTPQREYMDALALLERMAGV